MQARNFIYRNEMWALDKEMKLESLYKVGSESELNSWPVGSVSHRVWTEFSGRRFKCHSGQLSIAISKNPSVVNTIYIYIYNSQHHSLPSFYFCRLMLEKVIKLNCEVYDLINNWLKKNLKRLCFISLQGS